MWLENSTLIISIPCYLYVLCMFLTTMVLGENIVRKEKRVKKVEKFLHKYG